jgi:cellulose biosynthesis protein BcsQ
MVTSSIAFASAKGGSGKTVSCVAIGLVLAGLNKRVLLVDLDIETTGLTLLNLDAVLAHKRLLPDERGCFDFTKGTLASVELGPGLFLLPAQLELSKVEPNTVDIVEVLNTLRDKFDYVLLDLQAGADPVSVEAAKWADDVVVVSEFDPVSIQGIKRLQRLYPDSFAPDHSWILYSKVLPEISERMTDVLRVERKLPPTPWTVDVVRSYLDGRVPIDMVIPNTYTLSIVESVAALWGKGLFNEISEWRAQAESAKRAPLISRLASVEAELDELERNRIQVSSRLEARRSGTRIFIRAIGALSVTLFITLALLSARGYISQSALNAGALGIASVLLLTLGQELLGNTTDFFLRTFAVMRGQPFKRRYMDEPDLHVSVRRLERQIEALEHERVALAIASRTVGS